MSSYFCVFWESKFVLVLFNCFQFCCSMLNGSILDRFSPIPQPCLNWDFIGGCMNVGIGYRILITLGDIRISFSAIYLGVFTF